MLVPHVAMALHVSCDCGVSLANLDVCLFALLFAFVLFLFCFVLFCFGLVAWFVSASQ